MVGWCWWKRTARPDSLSKLGLRWLFRGLGLDGALGSCKGNLGIDLEVDVDIDSSLFGPTGSEHLYNL